MRSIITIPLIIILVFLLINACETHKDPFSSANNVPVIERFSFVLGSHQDSLKFKGDKPLEINLRYNDSENQSLTASFKFLSGSGEIFHSRLSERSRQGNSVTFDAPSLFNSDSDGRLNFFPDSAGLVEIELELSDKVKVATKTTTAFLFRNLAPQANFTAQLQSNVSPYQIEVDASESRDRDEGRIIRYYWSFGDGSPVDTTASKKFQHSYLNAGTYTVGLKVEDDEGAVDSTAEVISTSNQSPLAVLQVSPVNGSAPLTINYTATNSTDPDGEIVSYQVDFDDGAKSPDSAGSHTYTADSPPGDDYQVKLTVQDNLGQTSTAEVAVRVSTPPLAVLNVTPTQGSFPLDCIIDGSGSRDPQNGILEHDIFINGEQVYSNIDSVKHTFDSPGQYLVRLVVTSNRNGLTAEANRTVNVLNDDPLANFTWTPQTPQHRTPVTFTSTSSDPNETDRIVFYKWTFPFGVVKEGEDMSVVIEPFDAGVDTFRVRLEIWDKFQGTEFEGYDSIIKIVPKQ